MIHDRKIPNSDDPEILAEAARWIVRAQGGLSGAEQRAFRDWLAERGEHAAAAEAVACAWEAAPDAARRAGIAAPQRPPRAARVSQRSGWRAIGWEAVAAACVVPLLVGGTWWLTNSETRELTTGPHQRVVATLADGSTVWIAPGSHLMVRLDPFSRRLELRDGEMTVQVAHQRRSFSVDVGGYRIVDRGTLFDVRRRGVEPVSVALVNGQIDIHDRSNGKVIARPAAGERVALGVGGATRMLGDAQTAVTWRDGRVVLEDCPLSVALARFAEQGAPRVRVRDAAVGRLKVSGIFAVEHLDSFLSSVAELHPVTWRRSPQGYEVASR